MLPQGIFSVAVATVLFPTLARFAARGDFDDLRATMANGMRQIVLLLIPAAAAILVLSEPMIRLVYQRGEFGARGDRPGLRGALLVRVLAAVQRPLPAADADLLQPPAALGADRDRRRQPGDHGGRRARSSTSRSGSAGSSPRPAIATAASVVAQAVVLRRALGRLELGRLIWTTARVAARLRGARRRVSYRRLGRARRRARPRRSAARSSRSASALLAGAVVYGVALTLLRIPEASQVLQPRPARAERGLLSALRASIASESDV